jgi:Tol biopolymer transport system component
VCRRPLRCLLCTGIAVLVVAPSAWAGGTTSVVSTASDGTLGDASSYQVALSGDGSTLAFTSQADNLAAPGLSGTTDVYVRDLATGETTRVSTERTPGLSLALDPSLSDDGRYVAWIDALSVGWYGPNETMEVYDRVTGVTHWLSSGTGFSSAELSGDGRYVVYGNGWDVYRYDVSTGTSELVDRTPAGAAVSAGGDCNGQAGAWEPSVSDDGRHVAFAALSDQLSAGDAGCVVRLYVQDMESGSTTELPLRLALDQSHYPTRDTVSLTGDGRYAIVTATEQLLPALDGNTSPDVYRVGVADGSVSLVDVGPDGRALGYATQPSASRDGSEIAYLDPATGLVAVRDMTGGAAELVGTAPANTQPAIDAAGSAVAYSAYGANGYGQVYLYREAPADTTPPVTVDDAPPGWSNHAVAVHLSASDDGSGVAATAFSIDGGPAQSGSEVDVPAPADHSNDGVHVISYWSVDAAGNAEQPKQAVVRIDTVPPTISFAGDLGSYGVDADVQIACVAADALSGLAASTCPVASGPAWSFGVGATMLTATATDAAGNTATETATFSVVVDASSLCGLTRSFIDGSAKYARLSSSGRRVADALASSACSILTNLGPRLLPAKKPVFVRAYQAAVSALVPAGWLTDAQAAELRTLAASL